MTTYTNTLGSITIYATQLNIYHTDTCQNAAQKITVINDGLVFLVTPVICVKHLSQARSN